MVKNNTSNVESSKPSPIQELVAIIILFSEGKIAFNNHKIVLIKKIDYKDFEGAIKDWIKCAFYLGVVFSKTTEDHLSFFLGVDTK